MKFTGSQRAEIVRRVFMYFVPKSFGNSGRVEAGNSEMGSKGPPFALDPEFLKAFLDFTCERHQIRRGLHTCPENARAFLGGEEAETTETQFHGAIGSRNAQRCLDRVEFFGRR